MVAHRGKVPAVHAPSPTLQDVQTEPPGELVYVPALQKAQVLAREAPMAEEKVPEAQDMQILARLAPADSP